MELQPKTYPDTLDDQVAALAADECVERLTASRACLADDPHRPLYHFSAPEALMNDPNGLCRWRGRYHLFYQFGLKGPYDRIMWGHAVSDDLVHWRDLPPALYPDREKSCFSGQALVEDDRVIVIYHGVDAGTCIATANDPLLLNWRKHPDNPVIPIVPVDDDGAPYRLFDPCIWREHDGYYALSGTYSRGTIRVDCRGAEYLFHSKDLAEWEHLGKLIEFGFHNEPGEDGAVPNFLPIGHGRHMLLFFSHKRAAQYLVGTYDPVAHRFEPESHGRMTFGPWCIGSLHAPSAMVDEDGRVLAIFNVRDGKPWDDWTNVMTLPRCLSLADDHALRIEPAGRTDVLRFDHRAADPMEIPGNGEIVLEHVRGKAMEIEAVIEPGTSREVGLYVFRAPDGAERTRISLLHREGQRPGTSRLQIDATESSLREDVYGRPPEAGPFELDEGEPLHLRIFVDRSIVEVFANGRQSLTLRAYPQRDDSTGVSVFARGGSARLVSLDAWQMRSVWPELKMLEGK
ncbi:MAG: glycosyl hydrolase family 32 domain protein [Phycisphaeraceae bacterium]|nr:glycosyl hydrolase family 32 domain protein [Phycisphaeraceae bacterium]